MLEELEIGRMRLVFHASLKVPVDSDKLKMNSKGEEIAYLQFLKNTLGIIKSGPGLELEFKELRDSNISIKSIAIVDRRREL